MEKYDLVIHGGVVVNSDKTVAMNIAISNGIIRELLHPEVLLPPSDRSIDAAGRMIFPGGVDPHCHVGQRLGTYAGLDDYQSASTAALFGGTTTIVDFAIPQPDENPVAVLRDRQALAANARSSVAFHGCIVEPESPVSKLVAQMVELGVRTVKLFTTYRGEVMASKQTILDVMRSLKQYGGMPYVHAEANHFVEDSQHKMRELSKLDAASMPQTRPAIAELAAVSETIDLARYADSPVYFVHQTTGEAVDLVSAARDHGVAAHSEVCPHYLSLTDEKYSDVHPERFVCCPPLRDSATVEELNARAVIGKIDTIGSDHCCFSTGQKAESAHDVTQMPNGLPGVETRLPVAFTTLVVDHGMSINDFVGAFSTAPARLNGLENKGHIGVGFDADLVILDDSSTRTATSEALHMATDYTPYEGRNFHGWPEVVICHGKVVIEGDEFIDPGPVGSTLQAQAIHVTSRSHS
ncbi:amidohydrolase family protein [Spelaeicoccus albus]|uniref:Dihydropyrimidinase n=1 Tax=Spelaeicoccus albus TaxID=1280376 RepID=A0A7Z0ACS9_9MICO|nr:amidohydrolase family protein [Spelaeicoccus albus]NYI66936.1 dihydropyrimidinase [Spelaeicoccus albus]